MNQASNRTANIGRVVGKDPSRGSIVVQLDYRVLAEFGELWIIDDRDQTARYFVRVLDTTYGVDISKDGSISDFAKTLLRNAQLALNDSDKELIGFNFAFVDLLGIVQESKIEDFYRIPSILSEVRGPTDEEFEMLVK